MYGCSIQAWTPKAGRAPARQARHAAHPPFPPTSSYTTPSFGCAELPQAVQLTICFWSSYITCSLSCITQTRFTCRVPCSRQLVLFNMNSVSPLAVRCLCVCVISTHYLFILNLTADGFLAAASILPFHLPHRRPLFFRASICHSVRVPCPSQRKRRRNARRLSFLKHVC